jgi:hypothetical protein
MKNNRKTYTGTLAHFDVQNANGRVYTKEVFLKALEEYEARIENKTSYGTLGFEKGNLINLYHVSHVVDSFDVKDTHVDVNVTILNTPMGNFLKEKLESEEYVIRPSGTDTVNSQGVVENYRFTSTAFIPKSQDSF